MPRRNYSIDLAAIRASHKNPAHFYWVVSDYISFMCWSTHPSQLRKALQKAPEGVRLFWLIMTIEGPVENGGFGQYFGHRRPTWLHQMAKDAILHFGCPRVVEIIEEAERYLKANRFRLRKRMPWNEWAEVMGAPVMERSLRKIHRRFFRARANSTRPGRNTLRCTLKSLLIRLKGNADESD